MSSENSYTDKLKDYVSKKYGIINEDNSINLGKFFDSYYNAIAYARIFSEVPIYSIPKKTVSRYNPAFDLYLDTVLKNTNRGRKGKEKQVSIKKLALKGLLVCRCGSSSFSDEHQYLMCLECKNVELKKHILVRKSKDIVLKSKNFQYAKRSRILFEEWRQRIPSKQVRIRLEHYAFKDYELRFIKLMRRNLSSRKDLIKQYNIGVLSNLFSDKRHTELFNYDKTEYKRNATVYNSEIMKEGSIFDDSSKYEEIKQEL